MEITLRELITAIHGMLFGGFFLMALFGAIVLLLSTHSDSPTPAPRWQTFYLIAMVVLVLLKQRAAWNAHRQVRATVLGFAAAAFLAAAIAGGWGAMINKKAPVQGGRTHQLMGSAK